MAKKLLLIDGNSVLYRAFYGLPLLSTSKGLYTNAVYGFSMMLLHLLKEERPTHIVVAFDKGKATFRHQQFAEYKGKRQATPPEMIGQFQLARDILTHFGVRYLEDDRYEADDIIGTLSMMAEEVEDEYEVVVISGDKDLLQLVSPRVTTCLTKKGTTDLVRYDPALVRERFSLDPLQIIDLKGLMGDPSDNIPGVPGVGEKTAIKLLTQYPSVEEVLAHIDEISGTKLREKLQDNRDQALLSKHLATIIRDASLAVGLDELHFTGYDVSVLAQAFRELEFKALADRLQPYRVEDGLVVEATQEVSQIEPPDVREVLPADLSDELKMIKEQAVLLMVIDGDYQTGTLQGFVIAHARGTLFVPYTHLSVQQDQPAWDALAAFLQDESLQKIVFDSKAWLVRLTQEAIIKSPVDGFSRVFDTLLAMYLTHASDGEPALFDVVTSIDTTFMLPEPLRIALIKGGPQQVSTLAACATALYTSWRTLAKQLEEQHLGTLYEDVEIPLAIVLAELEVYGVRLDTDRLSAIGSELMDKIKTLTKKIYTLAGSEFNINSTKQLGEVLFEKMGLPPVKKTKTGYSTSADVLEKLAPQSEIVSFILEYRQLAKLQSTYIEGLLRVVRMPESRVHTSFHQAMAATGRLSSAEPNLQNIPIRMEEGRRLRQAFVPTYDDWLILSADYSQVELRILAHLCQDEALIDAFLRDMDIHTRTASDVFEVPPEEVTSLMRRQAKAVNFGIIYGISDYGLSQNLNISRAHAGVFIQNYFDKFPGVKRYMDLSVERAKELGYAETVMGRRRYLSTIHSRNFNERSFAERTAMNTPIQGTAADIIKVAMVRLGDVLRTTGMKSKMLLQVHDELIFECPQEELAQLKELVRQEMEGAVSLTVPLKVDMHEGPTWYEAK